ncbi:MAG: corrinoid protein [Lachnospiraceae bacterium oral taxon 082]|nr:corrinoid protein [Lachnospiraceae bacterium oral taxon 082]
MKSKDELLKLLAEYVKDMEDEKIKDIAREYLEAGYPAKDGILDGLTVGMKEAGKLYDEEEYYIAELLLCADAMYAGIDILKAEIKKDTEKKTKAIIGVIDGDTHDIGKNLVKIMLETAGFDMIDLGKDVAAEDFVKAAIDNKASLVCMSSLMSTTMYGMKKVIEGLAECGYRDNVKIMVGGGPVTESFAIQIGADAYSDNAIEAVNVAKRLCGLN